MVGTRTRELAALAVAAAFAATTMTPAFVATSARSATSGPSARSVTPSADAGAMPSDAILVAVASSTPGIAAVPATTSEPEPAANPTSGPPAPPAPACDPPPAGLTAAPVVSHGSRARKVVALTFDDGYNPTNTLRILGILRRSHVNATFFVTGRAVVLFPAVWQAVASAGFPIGDHTYDHRDLKGLCFDAQLRELTRQADVVQDALGHGPVALMRPPYGDRDRVTSLAAAAAGAEAVVVWDVDTQDWSGISSSTIARRALAGGKGSIVLMHTLDATTAAALPRIIAGYRARGFTFVTVGQLLGVPGPIAFG